MLDQKVLDNLCINTLRTLAMDSVQIANSGHPGAPMGMAPMAYTVWTRFLRHNPKNPAWPNRDRFILSGGHSSILLYSLLYLTGYDLSLEDLKQFRQWGSKTPGHPEYGHTPGLECTTGPLGQGLAMAVGMALAEQTSAAQFNKADCEIVNHFTYVTVGDGDLMEGVASEAASLAGHLKLGKLICLYDDNSITIDGTTDLAFTEDVAKRFESYGWHVRRIEHGDDPTAIASAIEAAQKESERPSLICIETHIGHGSPNKQDSHAAHGAPLGEEEIKLTKEHLGWPSLEPFFVPEEALAQFRTSVEKGAEAEKAWNATFAAYANAYPDLAKEWNERRAGKLPQGWEEALPDFSDTSALATRAASGDILNAIAGKIPALIGGSADLAPSNNTYLKDYSDIQAPDYSGRNIRYGVREHAMGALMNGFALYGGFIPYGGTFLVFADYLRPAIRLSALMKQQVVYVFTHDSIGLGEDGPTHQPVEHLASLRVIPNLLTLRPADATETAAAWQIALERQDGPTVLALSRQKLTTLSPAAGTEQVAKGAYVLSEAKDGQASLILIASGSEVGLAMEAQKVLEAKGVATRVVSMPCMELFERQSAAYREEVLPSELSARLAIEAGTTFGWERYTGDNGAVIGINSFGASAPGDILFQQFGFTVEHIVQRASELLE
ncbi:transketolase [candidate division KSB3 bacterium]|nr:MAG: transketolase [candidate division KSB3 bacterium]